MSFIPDIAILHFCDLSPAEIKVFAFYCKCRNKQSGGWKCTDNFVSTAMNISRNRVSEARAGFEKKGWILVEENHFIRPVFGFESVEFSTLEVENSTNAVENSTKSVENSTSPYKEVLNQTLNQETDQEDISTAHENFEVLPDGDFADEKHAEDVGETFLWLRQKKNMARLPQTEWLSLFAELEAESIPLDGFKDFYIWVENRDWIIEKKVAISPNVMRKELEGYKNREHFENRRIIKQKTGQKNGTNKQHHNFSNNGGTPKATAASIIGNRPYRRNIE